MLDDDVKQFSSTFHPCQNSADTSSSPTPDYTNIATLFHKFTLIPCSLSIIFTILSRPIVFVLLAQVVPSSEGKKKTSGDYIRGYLCNGVEWLNVTDNGPTFVAAVGYLSEKHHIKILHITPRRQHC